MHLKYRPGILAMLLLLLAPGTSFGQDLTTPKDVFRANIEATGGLEAWQNVNTMFTAGDMVMELDMATLVMSTESWLIRPDYLLTKMKVLEAPEGMPLGDNTIYITPEEGWIDSFQGRQELSNLPPSQSASMRSSMNGKEELGFLEQSDSLFSLLDSKEVNGSMVYVVEVKGDANTSRLYDHETLFLTGVEMASPMGSGTVTTFSSDYRKTGGVIVSYASETDLGMGVQTMSIRNIEINGDVTADKLAEMVKK